MLRVSLKSVPDAFVRHYTAYHGSKAILDILAEPDMELISHRSGDPILISESRHCDLSPSMCAVHHSNPPQ